MSQAHQAALAGIINEKFGDLDDRELRNEIVKVGQIYDYTAGQTILDYGSYVKMVPLVVSGRIKVMREDDDGNEIFLYYLDGGETCTMSFSCCMMSKRSEVRTVAEEDTRIVGIPVDYVDKWMTTYRAWKNFVMRAYDERMVELIKTIDSIAFKRMDVRLWEYLVAKGGQSEQHIIRATHQQISQDLNASREAISRLLKRLEQDGRIELRRNEIVLRDTEALSPTS